MVRFGLGQFIFFGLGRNNNNLVLMVNYYCFIYSLKCKQGGKSECSIWGLIYMGIGGDILFTWGFQDREEVELVIRDIV